MEYVDYKSFMQKNWKKNKKLHKDRLDKIWNSPSNRIDNKLSEYHFTSPCKHKTEKSNYEIEHDNEKHYSTINQISMKNKGKEVKVVSNRLKSLSVVSKSSKKLPKKEMELENWKMYQKLTSMKSQFSLKNWKKDFEQSKNYRTRISRPHLEKFPIVSLKKPNSTRQLIDSYSIAEFPKAL